MQPEKVKALQAKWDAWNAQIGTPNWDSNCDVLIPTLEDGGGNKYFYPW